MKIVSENMINPPDIVNVSSPRYEYKTIRVLEASSRLVIRKQHANLETLERLLDFRRMIEFFVLGSLRYLGLRLAKDVVFF